MLWKGIVSEEANDPCLMFTGWLVFALLPPGQRALVYSEIFLAFVGRKLQFIAALQYMLADLPRICRDLG